MAGREMMVGRGERGGRTRDRKRVAITRYLHLEIAPTFQEVSLQVQLFVPYSSFVGCSLSRVDHSTYIQHLHFRDKQAHLQHSLNIHFSWHEY